MLYNFLQNSKSFSSGNIKRYNKIYYTNYRKMHKTSVLLSSNKNNTGGGLGNMRTNFKNLNIWVKLIIIFILIPIIIYSFNSYLSYYFMIYINFLIKHSLIIQLLLCLNVVLEILYHIIKLSIINKFIRFKEKPILNKYIPSFISNEIFSLYEISKYSENDKSIIIGIFLRHIKFYIFILLIAIATLLIELIFFFN